MRIGQLSERTGVSTRMLRYYEQRGLLRPRREANGYRSYPPDSVELVASLRCLHDLGLDLPTAIDVARTGCGLDAPGDSEERARVVALIDAQLQEVDRRRAELADVEDRLRAFRRELTG